MDIGDRIKDLRVKNGLNQETLGKNVGVSIKTILRWEKGERMPRSNDIHNLASALGVSVSYLMGERETESDNEGSSKIDITSDNENSLVVEMGEGANKKRYVLPATAESYDFLRKLSEASEPDVEPKKMAILKMMEDMSPEDIDRMFDFLSGEKSQTTVSA